MSRFDPSTETVKLFKAAWHMASAQRRVSAYQLFRQAARLEAPRAKDATLGIIYAARFADEEMMRILGDTIETQAPEHAKRLDQAFSNFNRIRPYDADRAAELLSVRSPLQIEPVAGRLCYALSSSPPSTSGYASRTQGMAEGLRAAGLDVVGLTRPGYPWDRPDFVQGMQDDIDRVGDVDYHRIREPMRTGLEQHDYVERAIAAWQEGIAQLRPAAVMAASNWESALPAGIAARRLGLPFFYEVRGFWEMSRASKEDGFETTPLYAAWARLEAATAAAADHVFTLTEPMREELMIRGIPGERITLLPNACHPELFEEQSRDVSLAAELAIPQDVPVVGYVGSFVTYEGLEILIDACAALRRNGRQFRLLLVGSESGGPGKYSEALKARAEEEGLGDWLIMPGRVPHVDVPRYYSLIDIAPFPRMPHRVTETVSPLKPMEAMAMRKAVIVSDLRVLREIVRDQDTGIVFRRADPHALADAIDRLLEDADQRRTLGLNARRFIDAERTWRYVGQQAERVLSRHIALASQGTTVQDDRSAVAL